MVSTNPGGPNQQQHETQVAQQQGLSGPGQTQQENFNHTKQHHSLSNMSQPFQQHISHIDPDKRLQMRLAEYIVESCDFDSICIDPSITQDPLAEFDLNFDYQDWKTKMTGTDFSAQEIYNPTQSQEYPSTFGSNPNQKYYTPSCGDIDGK
jgi:hypothetical protein